LTLDISRIYYCNWIKVQNTKLSRVDFYKVGHFRPKVFYSKKGFLMDRYKIVRQEIIEEGGKIGKNASAFRILYALMKVRGLNSMHHSRTYIAQYNRIKTGRVDSLAKTAIDNYIETKELIPPIEFLFLPKSF
jgi:hypothetical protein